MNLLKGISPRLRRLARRVVDSELWRPQHAQLYWSQIANRDRSLDAGLTDHDHLVAAAGWLQRAQDVMPDGGVCGRYRLGAGWTSSYPETTGYIIPTFLALAREFEDPNFEDRAERCVRFLLPLQGANGAFPAGEIQENQTEPSVFNTAQIISGLIGWHAATDEANALDAAYRAADWLLSVQDADGAWRSHVYERVPATYSAHAACWLAQLGAYMKVEKFLEAAGRHLDWVLRQQDQETGWVDLAGFTHEDHESRRAATHSIAYTLWGALRTAEILDRPDGVQAVGRAAMRVARRLELSGWLPGVLDARWRRGADYACLTGNAQMALTWFRLFDHDRDARWASAGFKALDLVKRAQLLFVGDPDMHGGIPGSDPIWGDYLTDAIPNWAAKFFIDALLAKKKLIAKLHNRPGGGWVPPADVPHSLPDERAASVTGRPRIVLYSNPASHKVPQLLDAWADWGFRPSGVVFERAKTASPMRRVRDKVKRHGLGGVVRRLCKHPFGLRAPIETGSSHRMHSDPVAFCRNWGLAVLEVDSLDSAEGVAAVQRLRPDLAIHAGAGILRRPILAVPRFGTLNAHMGILPRYRGMNVAEWAAFNGDPVGCSVHLIDPGIDTGAILCVREVDVTRAASVQELREMVDLEQVRLLGEVVQFILRADQLPPQREQDTIEGLQFFTMHPDLRRILERAFEVRLTEAAPARSM